MFKKLLTFLLAVSLLALAAGTAVFYYRHSIIEYSVDRIVKSLLPPYVKIDDIEFRFKENAVVVRGFRVADPPGFSGASVLEIGEISCGYSMRGDDILDGIELLSPVLKGAVLSIERNAEGRMNIFGMEEAAGKTAPAPIKESPAGKAAIQALGDRKISDIIKLPEVYSVLDGKVVFTDRYAGPRPHVITLENIRSELFLSMDESYGRVNRAGSRGRGVLNGKRNETIDWDVKIDPAAATLTMSNRFHVSGLDITVFEPYYDRYSPFAFKAGKFSGDLIFDFNNGGIGSTNEVRLSSLRFYIKPDFKNAGYWEANIEDLIRYFTASTGEIIFDFKIKGEMSNPKFYLGPVSKQAMTSMAIDKVSGIIEGMSKKAQDGVSDPGGQIEKFNEYLKTFKGLIDKK